MGDDAYNRVAHFIGSVASVEDGLRVLRETTPVTAAGAMQRTIIDCVLRLSASNDKPMPSVHQSEKQKRSLVDVDATEKDSDRDDTGNPSHMVFLKVPKKSARTKQPSEKARE